ncbi:Rab proteins geranylgeranyltransferase component A [Trapelia coarctata]|nr:Rab proteins geranylgeranyltransferase component A [Trapelia coarctata]
METLSETEWDVVISGTGLPQSLLALALSPSGKKVLHVDRNGYYGGAEAALSLQDAVAWVKTVNDCSVSFTPESLDSGGRGKNTVPPTFKDARIITPNEHQSQPESKPAASKLGFSRAYSLALSPQLIYSRSALLPTIVSSKIQQQLEFLAVGSWWIFVPDEKSESNTQIRSGQEAAGTLKKIPGGREDVFADKTIDLKSKRSLMKFLRHAADTEALQPVLDEWGERSFQELLTLQYGLSTQLQSALHALTLSPEPPSRTKTSYALPRITRHLTSIGVFGPGFGSVIPKWGGIAEIAQVACRAGAVGGGVYVLGQGVKSVTHGGGSSAEMSPMTVQLQDEEIIRTKWVAGCHEDLSSSPEATDSGSHSYIVRSISIVSGSMSTLFPLTAEGAPPPAGAVVVFPEDGTGDEKSPPVYLMVHSSDTGECPAGQCVIYASTLCAGPQGYELLDRALEKLLDTIEEPEPSILWSLRYAQRCPSTDHRTTTELPKEGGMITFAETTIDLAFDDGVLQDVKRAWTNITGETTGFMQFENRGPGIDDDEDV